MSSQQNDRASVENGGVTDRAAQDGFVDLPTLWRRRWTLLQVTLVACLFGFVFLQTSTPLFESEAKVMVQIDEQLLVNRRLDQKVFMENQAQLMQSPIILSEATAQLSGVLGAPSADELKYLNAEISVSPIASTNVLVVGVRGHDPESPVKMLRAVIQSYLQLIAAEDQKTSQLSLQQLRLAKEHLEQEMVSTKEELLRLRSETANVTSALESVDFQIATLKQIETEAKEVRRHRREFSQLLDRFSRTETLTERGTPIVSTATIHTTFKNQAAMPFSTATLDQPISGGLLAIVAAKTGNNEIAKIQQELRDAQSNVEGMLHKLGTGHPDRVAAESRVALLEIILANALKSAIGQLHYQLLLLADRETELERQHAEARLAVRSATEGELQEKRQLDRLAKLDEMYLDLLKRQHELEQQTNLDEPPDSSIHVRVLDEPKLTADTLWPRSFIVLAACGCFGLVAGCVLVTVQSGAIVSDSDRSHEIGTTVKRMMG